MEERLVGGEKGVNGKGREEVRTRGKGGEGGRWRTHGDLMNWSGESPR